MLFLVIILVAVGAIQQQRWGGCRKAAKRKSSYRAEIEKSMASRQMILSRSINHQSHLASVGSGSIVCFFW